jgi:hypothetical protein
VPRVYLHEFVDVVGTRRAQYQHHMTANWCPEAGPLRRQACFGVFSLVGSTGRWPQVVNLWEYASWDDLAHNFSVELVGSGHRDPMLAAWWAEAASFRTGGFDRVMVAHPSSPSAHDWATRGGTGAVAYAHELVRTAPGAAPELLDELVLGSHGPDDVHSLELVAAFTTAMRAEDELLVLRAVPDWSTWSRVEAAAAASPTVPEGVVERQRVLLVDAELSPLRIGRQPSAEDRRPLDSF